MKYSSHYVSAVYLARYEDKHTALGHTIFVSYYSKTAFFLNVVCQIYLLR